MTLTVYDLSCITIFRQNRNDLLARVLYDNAYQSVPHNGHVGGTTLQ
jgi:hypothetical protein